MELKLQNIGIIKDANIKLNGLTIITGPNNSGKSTIGKALYSLVRAKTLPPSAYQEEVIETKFKYMNDIIKKLKLNDIITRLNVKEQLGERFLVPIMLSGINNMLSGNLLDDLKFKKLYAGMFDNLDEFFREFNENYILESSNDDAINKDDFTNYLKNLPKIKEEAQELYNQYKESINAYSSMEIYNRNMLSRILKAEFSEQVISSIFLQNQPIKGSVSLNYNDKKDNFICSQDGGIYQDDFKLYNDGFSSVILIDNAYMMDSLNKNEKYAFKYLHNAYLIECLKEKVEETTFEEEKTNSDLKEFLIKISESFPGTISNASGNYTYSDEVIKNLFVQNLATGSKCLGIIKQLLVNKQLRRNTLLILDEPESHLHPEWQNIFANFIIALVKNFDVKVLLTTHSPNFLLALDTYSRKEKIMDNFDIYQSEKAEDHSVTFKCVNECINEAYAALSEPFLKLNAMRCKILSSKDKEID